VRTMNDQSCVIVGAGIGGLVSAALLSAQGERVIVCDMAPGPGGKACTQMVDGAAIAAGPTVFTLRAVFEDIFDVCGASLSDSVTLRPANILARHGWGDGSTLDLFADVEASHEAIAAFAGAREARGFKTFMAAAERAYVTLDNSFMRASATSPIGLATRIGAAGFPAMVAMRPMARLWPQLGRFFSDPRLQQLFGRYATYCGASPFQASATLMLIAHVEAMGVWMIDGGIAALAKALETVAKRHGAQFRYGEAVREIETDSQGVSSVTLASGERIAARRVIVNADPQALTMGWFGEGVRKAVQAYPAARRSLSAITFLGRVEASGFPLAHHNVFFSGDYAREFAMIAAGYPPDDPTIYLCAQDRIDASEPASTGERIQIIVNAPANGDTHPWTQQEIDQCHEHMLRTVSRSGLRLVGSLTATTPRDWEARFPATGGALYGMASHGWAASFQRPGSRTRIPGLYLAGGGTHPGAGVPMAALSGRLAAASIIADRTLTRSFHPAAMAGGMSTRSATVETMG
jgi:1-hydroxycarotenoid 3,4-desaturase